AADLRLRRYLLPARCPHLLAGLELLDHGPAAHGHPQHARSRFEGREGDARAQGSQGQAREAGGDQGTDRRRGGPEEERPTAAAREQEPQEEQEALRTIMTEARIEDTAEQAPEETSTKPSRAEILAEEGELAAEYLEELVELADTDRAIDSHVADRRAQHHDV